MFNKHNFLFLLFFIPFMGQAETFTLTVEKIGQGTITSTSPGIQCGSQCQGTYAPDEKVSLVATPDANVSFVGWSGNCSGTSATTFVIMTQNKVCKAQFEPIPIENYDLTVITTQYGHVTSDLGLSCGEDASCSARYAKNTQIKLSAKPNAEAEFVGWEGECLGTSLDTQMIIDKAKSCLAKFKLKPAKLTVSLAGQGSITSTPTGITCGTTCSATYEIGTEVTLTAQPSAEFTFVGWGGECAGQDNPIKITIDQTKTCIANFEVALSVEKKGQGIITSQPAGIDCGEQCEFSYQAGQEITLTAQPEPGYEFTSWEGDCQGTTQSIKVTLNKAQKCIALFDVYLTVEKTGQGTIQSTPAGIDCGQQCKGAYPAGEAVTLKVEPDKGYQFIEWQGDCSGTELETIVTIEGAKKCKAIFALLFTVEKKGEGDGEVTSQPTGITCGNQCTAPYDLNQKIILTALPQASSEFSGWGGDCEGFAKTITVTLDKEKTCQANFVLLPPEGLQNLTVIPQGHGQITSEPKGISCGDSCTFAFEQGKEILLTALAEKDSKFSGWGGECQGNQAFTTIALSKASTCTAKFELLPPTYPLIVDMKEGEGTITSTPAGIQCGGTCTFDFPENTPVTLSLTPSPTSSFMTWFGDCSGTALTTQITMGSTKKCTAFLKLKPSFNVTVTKTGLGNVTSIPEGITCGDTECLGSFPQGENVQLMAVPDASTKFSGWSGACPGIGNPTTLMMDAAKSCQVKFEPKPTYPVKVVKVGNGEVTSDIAGLQCGQDCEESFYEGAQVILTATPQPNSNFQGWTGCPPSPNNPAQATVTINAATTCTATFGLLPPLKLTVTQQGTGTGVVTAPPGRNQGIQCGPGCSEDYEVGSAVTLTAQANANSVFTGWRGACSGTELTSTVTMTEGAKNCVASFYLLPPSGQFNLTVTETLQGKVTSQPAGIDCEPHCTAPFDSVVTLTATPSENLMFTSWTGDCQGAEANIAVLMNTAKTCTAHFFAIPPLGSHLLTVVKTGQGTVTSVAGTASLPVIDCGKTCTSAYAKGTALSLTAQASPDYIFGGWQCGTLSAPVMDNPLPVTINENTICTAHFNPTPSSLQFAINQYFVNEFSGEAIFLVTRAASHAGIVSVDYNTVDGTALSGSDYEAKNGTLIWADGDQSHKLIKVRIFPDTLAENPEETFGVSLSHPQGQATLINDQATVSIIDTPVNGAGIVQFASANYLVDEKIREVLIGVERLGGQTGAISVNYATTDVSATAGNDYLPTQGILNWKTGETAPQFFTVPILEDNLQEGQETLVLTLSNPLGGGSLGAIRSTQLSIVDTLEGAETSGVLQFKQAIYPVKEGSLASLAVGRFPGNRGEVSVHYSVQPGTAQAGSDYTPLPPGVLTWTEGDATDKNINLTILSDALPEETETFRVTLSSPTGLASLGAASSALLQIEDSLGHPSTVEETPTHVSGVIQFVEKHYQVSENKGTATIVVSRTQGSEGVVEVNCTTQDGTAKTSQDYLGVKETLRWLDGDNKDKTIKIDLLDNALPQDQRELLVILDPPTGGAILGENTQTTLTILDDDTTTIQFAADRYAVNEDSKQATVTVTRQGGNISQVSVQYETKDFTDSKELSATADQDYLPTHGFLTWVSGNSLPKNLVIPIREDEEIEGNEKFQVRLSTLEGNAIFGSPSETTVTIIENDSENCQPPTINCFYQNNGTLQDIKITVSGTVSGGQLGGNIINEGMVQDVTLLPHTQLSGGLKQGRVRGTITSSNPQEPATLTNIDIDPETTISHLIVGRGSKLDKSVHLQEGVCFEDNATIPVTDLVGILGYFNTPYLSIDAVQLTQDVLCLSALGGLVGAINGLSELKQWTLSQNLKNGYLEMEVESLHYAVLPTQIRQILDLEEQPEPSIKQGISINPDGEIIFVTHTSREISTLPVIQDPLALQRSLSQLNFPEVIMQPNGNLKVPIGNGSYYNARPDLLSLEVPHEVPLGLDGAESIWSKHIGVVFLVFEPSDTGMLSQRRKQFFYPAPADPQSLRNLSVQTVLELNGRVEITLGERHYEGVLDYLVTPGTPTDRARIVDIEDINQDGLGDYRIIYPHGDEQVMYQLPNRK